MEVYLVIKEGVVVWQVDTTPDNEIEVNKVRKILETVPGKPGHKTDLERNPR